LENICKKKRKKTKVWLDYYLTTCYCFWSFCNLFISSFNFNCNATISLLYIWILIIVSISSSFYFNCLRFDSIVSLLILNFLSLFTLSSTSLCINAFSRSLNSNSFDWTSKIDRKIKTENEVLISYYKLIRIRDT
jgi:hypothetical protein